jgi:hypothetical protein
VTLFLDLRAADVGGPVSGPSVLEGDGTISPLRLRIVPMREIEVRARGKNVLFATHGFNVSRQEGARSLGRLESLLPLPDSALYLAVLWPGDFWIPVVNYPFAGGPAMECGRRLAAFAQQHMGGAQSLSFASHSLGVRLVLEAAKKLPNGVRVVCLLAAAINRDCLQTEYARAAANAQQVSILASHCDDVLKIAFRIGDPLSELFHDDHKPFEKALGYNGPPTPARTPIVPPWQIPDAAKVRHTDYLPPSSANPPDPLPDPPWEDVAGFIARAFREVPQSWP